jgi:hypothetical protein
MVFCNKCDLKLRSFSGILEFPFKIYEQKSKMRFDLLTSIKRDKNFIFQMNEKYNSNIIHELVYKLVKTKYLDKLYRKQHVWALEIISSLPEYPSLTSQKNIRDEIPIQTYIRLVEDRYSKDYNLILKILLHNDKNNVKIVKSLGYNLEPEEDYKYLIIYENPLEDSFIDSEISIVTHQYHNLQKKLFGYLEENYGTLITKCEKCNSTIDIFSDFEKIGQAAKKDRHKKILVKNIEHIIALRNKGVDLGPSNDITKRHQHIVVFFEKLLEALGN